MLADETRQAIARLLVDRGSASQEEIAGHLGLSRGAISEQMGKLSECSLVKECGGWPRVYEPSSLVRRWGSLGE